MLDNSFIPVIRTLQSDNVVGLYLLVLFVVQVARIQLVDLLLRSPKDDLMSSLLQPCKIQSLFLNDTALSKLSIREKASSSICSTCAGGAGRLGCLLYVVRSAVL
jgi:hypothetical protein